MEVVVEVSNPRHDVGRCARLESDGARDAGAHPFRNVHVCGHSIIGSCRGTGQVKGLGQGGPCKKAIPIRVTFQFLLL